MQTEASFPSDASGRRGRDIGLWLALALVAVVGPVFFEIQITHDAAWQMWIGRQLLHGADLYSDIIEVNPPLWFWIAEALSALAQLLGISGLGGLVTFFLLCIAISVVLSDTLLQDLSPRLRALLLV